MNNAVTAVYRAPKQAGSLTRADALEREITNLCAQINAANHRLLQLIAELDDEEPWGTWGLQSCAHWLNWRCGIGLNAAREKVRVAHALKGLPVISADFASGRLSFSKVRALTRIANSENETELLHLAHHATAAQVEKLVRAYRSVAARASGETEREAANARHAARELTYYHDDDGSLVIRARLPAEQGAIVLQAINALLDSQEPEEPDDVTAVTSEFRDGFAQRRADALAKVAETALEHSASAQTTADRYQVVVHVTAETFCENSEHLCELDSGQRIAPDTARRIACDASLLRITEDANGKPLDIGRKSRAVPPAMQRALRLRDRGCRFPGCTCERFVDAHHIRHWAEGGETALDNLVLLCRRHHRLVHEGGFGVERLEGGSLRFTQPNGQYLDQHPELPQINASQEVVSLNSKLFLRPVDTTEWVIPGGVLNLDLAVGGLMQMNQSTGQ